MIKKREKKLSVLMVVIQVLLTLLMFFGTSYFFPYTKHYLLNTLALIAQITLIWGGLLYYLKLGTIFRATKLSTMLRGYMVTVFSGCLLLFLEVIFISHFRPINYSIEYIVIFGTLNLAGLIIFKFAFYNGMLFLRRKGYNKRNVLIIANPEYKSFIESFINAKDWGYEAFSIVSVKKEMKKHFKNAEIFTTNEELFRYIQSNPVDDIFYCLPITDNTFDVEKLIEDVKTIGVTLYILQHPDIKKGFLFRQPSLMNMNYVTHSTVTDNYLGLKIKDLFDVVFSVIALFIVSPLIILIITLIKLNDGGDIFFIQERVGLNGRLFRCFKFRTMVMNAESLLEEIKGQNEADGPVFKIGNDPRITKLGRFLRKTSLDELPQFYNVIKGEMSIVGPRPPLMREVQHYEQSQMRRLSMKPGITCGWQVWGRHQVSFKEWMQMDLDYIDNWSLWLDLKIMIATVGVILKANGQ
ncbi:MAG: sugar transferase [Paludibacter sp.]